MGNVQAVLERAPNTLLSSTRRGLREKSRIYDSILARAKPTRREVQEVTKKSQETVSKPKFTQQQWSQSVAKAVFDTLPAKGLEKTKEAFLQLYNTPIVQRQAFFEAQQDEKVKKNLGIIMKKMDQAIQKYDQADRSLAFKALFELISSENEQRIQELKRAAEMQKNAEIEAKNAEKQREMEKRARIAAEDAFETLKQPFQPNAFQAVLHVLNRRHLLGNSEKQLHGQRAVFRLLQLNASETKAAQASLQELSSVCNEYPEAGALISQQLQELSEQRGEKLRKIRLKKNMENILRKPEVYRELILLLNDESEEVSAGSRAVFEKIKDMEDLKASLLRYEEKRIEKVREREAKKAQHPKGFFGRIKSWFGRK